VYNLLLPKLNVLLLETVLKLKRPLPRSKWMSMKPFKPL
jgi:hypothetical protein